MDIPRIGVFPAKELETQKRLLSGVEEVCDVRFVPGRNEDLGTYEAAVLFRASYEQAASFARTGLRCLAFLHDNPKVLSPDFPEITLAATSYLPTSLRATNLSDTSVRTASPIRRAPGDEVIARRGDDILWLRHREGESVIELVATPPPYVSPDNYLFSSFQESRWFALLPLLHFSREVSGWTVPSGRACFMFDDPNLRWRSYGYVKYGELASDARLHRYHVAFATVPLDGWYVHRPTADLFRDNREQLSLLVHGNNHTRLELYRASTDENRRALASQALRRIDRLENVSKVHVPRIMAAPHGACSAEMANALLQAGFEAASISQGSLMSRNGEVTWPIGVGLHPATFFGGLPVLPRFGFREASEAYLRLAMFLGQPLISMGHHEDLRSGLDYLRQIAARINSIGSVHWTDTETIARGSCLTRRRGDCLHLKMYSRRISVQVPQGVDRILVHRPWLEEGQVEQLVVVDADRERRIDARAGDELLLQPLARDLTIACSYPEALDRYAVPTRGTWLHAIIRRQLCEIRDRLRPSLDPLLDACRFERGRPLRRQDLQPL